MQTTKGVHDNDLSANVRRVRFADLPLSLIDRTDTDLEPNANQFVTAQGGVYRPLQITSAGNEVVVEIRFLNGR